VIERLSADAEQACGGFWPGNETHPAPAFSAYTFPAPEGIDRATITPAHAAWQPGLGEFILPYKSVRNSADPRAVLLAFLESTFRAGAELAAWPTELLAAPGAPSSPDRVRSSTRSKQA
jgi:hypothetical protein